MAQFSPGGLKPHSFIFLYLRHAPPPPRIIRSKIFFLESVAVQLHTHILSSHVDQSLKSYGHFSDFGVEIALSHRHVECFG